jgi:ribonucleoside-diphosphate reductase alpha chain
MQKYGIDIDLGRDHLFDELGLKRLRESYMTEDEISPQQRFAFIATTFGTDLKHATRLYDYASKHWLSFSTPILSFGKTKNGLPISCYLPYMHDTSEGLVDTLSEVNWLSMKGGGVGVGVGIRASDDKSTGVMPHLKIYDASSLAYRQGKTRRGSYAMYLDISHPDIMMFLDMRKPTGDPNIRCANLHHGINIPDSFMQIIERCMVESNVDDSWPLIDPHTNELREIVSAKDLWQKILENRMLTGEPYLHFIDTSNRFLNDFQKDKKLTIKQSNLCTEIILPTNEYRTAVCCLSSLNIEYFDSWKDNALFIRDVAEMLDNVLQYFIEKAPMQLHRAVYSATQERSIGIGQLGFHAYLQQHNCPFEGAMAKSANMRIARHIKEQIDKANYDLGAERGEAPDAKGTGRRFSNTQAIAPNATSSIIMQNTSPSIEPYRANAYRQDTLSGSFLNKNRYLDKIIHEYCGANGEYNEVWSSIIINGGSVQHLTWMDDHVKAVFKTAMEIDQRWIIEHAADRQKFIDQSQSVNLFFPPNADIKYLHLVHFLAWKKGLKTLYYCRSEKIGKADKISQQITREKIEELDLNILVEDAGCLACEG